MLSLEVLVVTVVVVVVGLERFALIGAVPVPVVLLVRCGVGGDNSCIFARSFRLFFPNVNTFHALRDIRSVSNWKDCKCKVSYVRLRCPRIILISRTPFIISAREYPASRNNASRMGTGIIISRPHRRGPRFSSYSSNGTVHSDSCLHPIDIDGPQDDAGLSPIARGKSRTVTVENCTVNFGTFVVSTTDASTWCNCGCDNKSSFPSTARESRGRIDRDFRLSSMECIKFDRFGFIAVVVVLVATFNGVCEDTLLSASFSFSISIVLVFITID